MSTYINCKNCNGLMMPYRSSDFIIIAGHKIPREINYYKCNKCNFIKAVEIENEAENK